MGAAPVFVSSTFTDLKDFRKAVSAVIRRLGAVDMSMENFGSNDNRPLDECVRIIRSESEFFVGIYAYRYGYVPDGEETSITESEYDAAHDAGLPVLAYLVKESSRWPETKIEKGEGAIRLNRFKEVKLKKRHIVTFFSRKDELAASVAADLGKELRRTETRIAVMRKLSIEGQEREQRLLASLNSEDNHERERAVSALSSLGSDAAVTTLKQLMLGPNVDLARSAVKALEWSGAVIDGLLSPHSEVRFWAAFRVGENALQDHEWGLKQASKLIEIVERRSEEISVLDQAVHSLGKIGGRSSMETLLKVLHTPGTPAKLADTALHAPTRFWRDPMFASYESYDQISEFKERALEAISTWTQGYCEEVANQEYFEYLPTEFREQIKRGIS